MCAVMLPPEKRNRSGAGVARAIWREPWFGLTTCYVPSATCLLLLLLDHLARDDDRDRAAPARIVLLRALRHVGRRRRGGRHSRGGRLVSRSRARVSRDVRRAP